MNFIFFILSFSFLFQFSLQDENNNNTDIDPTLTFKCITNNDKIEIGDTVFLCIHFKELHKKMVFKVEVDKYSTLTIAGAYQLALQGYKSAEFNNTISFVGEINDKVTKMPSEFEDQPSEFFPVLNLVVKVDEGVITDIVWDNQCYSCSNKYCEELSSESLYKENVTFNYKNCKNDTNSNNFYGNDPKFYLTWFGTDKEKRQMKSSNLAMSKFKQYSIGSLYNSVRDSFSIDEKKIVPDDIKEYIKKLLNLNNTSH